MKKKISCKLLMINKLKIRWAWDKSSQCYACQCCSSLHQSNDHSFARHLHTVRKFCLFWDVSNVSINKTNDLEKKDLLFFCEPQNICNVSFELGDQQEKRLLWLACPIWNNKYALSFFVLPLCLESLYKIVITFHALTLSHQNLTLGWSIKSAHFDVRMTQEHVYCSSNIANNKAAKNPHVAKKKRFTKKNLEKNKKKRFEE